ncbi:protein TASOR 2 isoform X2 [Clinocottus analis]|uniref:protein TASOR 2 isoform X2 n=1 Tax=Clinocottus analis TaxID=304258 RepID=UPI0035BEBAAA
MESGNGGASTKGVLIPVSERCDVFQSSILTPLKSAYLYEESKQSFRYKSAVLVQNPALEEKYNAFREKRREVGYSEEDLKESYGFLLFEDTNQANSLRETGVLPGNSTCTTLGDPSKGVYISMYSDCLDLNRWYHGKSGYIAIIRLTKGRVKRVLENYTQNFTAPTVGFDCHVSEQLPSVSSKTSSFLAFERTQYYMYELLDDGSNVKTQSPSAALPAAIVSFSYADTKATLEAPQEKSEEKKLVCQYFPWRGQLQIGSQFYDVGLRSTAGALIPAVLPPIIEIGRAISMLNLRQLLPRAVFETCFSGEVFLDGLYFSLCELVSSEVEETHSLALLLREIKQKDLALTIQLNDGGFLILLHSSHFLKYDDTGSSATDVLQGMFVFPNSQVIQRDTKFRKRKLAMSSEILQALPVLSYAEGEVEKTPFDPSEELCEVLAQHMQTYAALINPGLASSPTREVSVFPDQYDVPDAHKHLYSSPEWTNKAWQSFRSYLSKPDSFQLPVSKASEILAAGQEERMEDLDDDVYICLSSPEEPTAQPVSMESEDQLTGPRSPVNSETPVDSYLTNTESLVDFTTVPQNVVPDNLQAGDATKDTCKSDRSLLNKTGDMGEKILLTPSTSDDLPAELIVSITSAEQTITNEGLSMISTVSATKQNDFQLSGFSTAKLQTEEVSCLNDASMATKKVLDCPEVTKTKRRKRRRGPFTSPKKVSKAGIETSSLQIPVEDDNFRTRKKYRTKLNVDRRKVQMRTCKFRQLSIDKNVISASVGLAVPDEKETAPGPQGLENTIVMDFEACPLRKKTERWDLKPVISECGRILVPHGSVDFADQIKSLKDELQSTKEVQCPGKMLVDTFVNTSDEMMQESNPTQETVVGGTEATPSKDRGNHLQHVVSDDNPEHSISGPSEDGKGSLILNSESNEHFSRTHVTATPSEAVKEKPTDALSLGKIAKKGEFLLSKLKSVLLRGKRKTDLLSEETTVHTAKDTEPCLKKGKVESQAGNLKSNYAITSVQDTNVCVKEVSKMLSVDPIFAYALGLTPKETVDKIQKTESRDTQQEQTIFDKQTQILHRPSPIFPRRGRIKTLKKHQGISTEYVKQKWWLHFQTPTCFASEKLKLKECTRDNSVRKTVKEQINSACSSTDALSLLADLALSASNDQVPPQPDPSLERKTETSLKKCDLSKDLTSAEQESVLHSLLRQPAARPMQPLESTSPNHLVESREWVGLVSKEHAYSLLPSSSLLLGLPGTPFQVSPLSGSSRLLRHHQTMYGNGIKTVLPPVGQEDGSEQNHRTPEYLKKHMVRRRKFRHSRTFVNKDGSIQVTKQWKENYDFDLDSKFSNDSKDRTIVRALHGPWDFSMQDTSEEVRLIVHMWIGLFYSRSTSRFFHVDSYPHSEESDSLSSKMVSPPAQSELKANSFAPFPSITDTSISKVLDFSQKEDSKLDQGAGILDLSLKNTNAEIVSPDPQANRKETSASIDQKEASETLNTLESSVGPKEASAIQRSKMMVHSTEIINEVNDVRSADENKRTCTPLEKERESQEPINLPSCIGGETMISVQEKMKRVSVRPEMNQTTSGINHVLHGYSNQKTDVKDGRENSEGTEMSLVQNHGKDSSKSVTDKEVDTTREADDVLHTVEHGETESKGGENWEVKEKPYQEGNVEPSLGIGHVLHGYNNQKTDMKDGRENSEVTDMSLVQNHGRDSSKFVTNEEVDTNREAVGVLHTVEHDGTESKAQKNWEVKEKPYKEGNVEPSLGIGHVLHGYNNQKTDMKDGRENSEVTEMSLVQNHGKDSSKSVTNEEVDTNREAGGVLDTVEHHGTESRTGENWEVKEKPYQEGHVEPSSGIGHVLHGYNDQKTDMKDGRENSEVTKMSLVQNHGRDSFKSVTDEEVDTNREVGGALHTVEHDGTESKKRKNWDVKEKPYQEGNVEPSPEVINAKDPTNKELDIVCNGHVLENEMQLPTEEPKAVSPDVAENMNEDVDCCTLQESTVMEDHIGKQDGHDERESCISPVETDKRNEALEKIHSMIVIPFIGIDTSGEDTLRPYDSYSQGKVEQVIQGQEEIPFIGKTTYTETVLPTGVCSDSKMDSEKAERSVGNISLSLINVTKTNHPGSESDDRCSTPTMDEKPYEYLTCSASALNQKRLSRDSTSMKDEIPHRSTINCDASPHCDLHPDVELRTLRVLQSIDKFLSISSHSDTSSQIETVDMKRTLDQTAKPRSKNITTCFVSSHTSFNSKDKRMSNTAPAVVAASTSQELNTESAGHFLISPFKSKLEEVLGVKLQLQKTDSSVHQHYFERTDKIQETSRSGPATESLQAINPTVDQDKTTSETNSNHEARSNSQRPVMAVKPCQSDESQGISKYIQIKNAVMSHFSKDKQTKNLKATYITPTTMLLVKNTESLMRTSKGVNDVKQEASELSTKSSCLPNVSDSKSQDISKLNKIPSSQPVQSFESAKSSSKFNDRNQGSVETKIKNNIQMIQKECFDASTSHADNDNGAIIDDGLSLGPQSSLICTVYNTDQKRSYSFLEQVSQRCIQDDLTEASMEQECLIFSEKMKHLLKRSKRAPISQQDTHDILNLSRASPVTVHFCGLEEQEDSVDHLTTHLSAPSLVGQKIKVDMPERKDLTEKEKTLRLQNISPGAGNPMEHAGVSAVTSECARLYKAMMTDVCAVKKIPSGPQHFRMDRSLPKSEPGNHFDFCDQMKRDLDKSFRSNLNSVVKKSCKTKYRFYILVTSDDAFFEETKAQLEAEGHTAAQPSQFFLGEDSSSSLLIILRNEDIAEHICEVPHLLKLKTSPGVQFAGIDEPDDVVNLTHQELFTRGGFIMLDRAALEPLSLCDMKKMSEILQELSGMGKWKWMMHYRDSRRLKENARLSAEAKEKKHFLNFCQETGLLEVLPYHECDLMSRDLPDYLTCLVRLQVQNISARYPVFITDTTTDSAFGKNGILTMTFQSFLTYSQSETFTA